MSTGAWKSGRSFCSMKIRKENIFREKVLDDKNESKKKKKGKVRWESGLVVHPPPLDPHP